MHLHFGLEYVQIARLQVAKTLIYRSSAGIGALGVFIQTPDAGGGRSTPRHTAYDYNFHLAPSTIAAIADLGR